ncbi:MAG: hypothetical protein JJU00_02740 [Opitutales bacterium]|nr:hypothetical protein [Opitutales bacterium]
MEPANVFPYVACPVLLSILGAALISLLVSVGEVVAAFSEQPYHTRKAVVHPWALLYYALFALITVLIGLVAYEWLELNPSWGWTIALGLLGPTLLKSNVALFRPFAGSDGLDVPLQRMIDRLQSFLFAEITVALSTERIEVKERLARELPEDRLLERLRALYPSEEWARIEPLIKERRQQDRESVPAFLVELIEKKDHNALERLAKEVKEAGDNEL